MSMQESKTPDVIAASMRSGFVSVIGRPNVGKSTLVNAIIGQKVSIVTHKAQTTRHRILGIKTTPGYQIVLVDTPGFHLDAKHAINKMMNKAAMSALHDVEIVMLVAEACRWHKEEQKIVDKLGHVKVPVIAVVSKIDLLPDKDELLPYISALNDRYQFSAIVPVSARSKQGLMTLENEIVNLLPEGSPFYAADDVTDRSLRFQAAELIREQLYLALNQELPYAITVEIEAYEESEKIDRIAAVVWVAKASHKGIVIGKQGAGLKVIAQNARLAMESAFQKKVYLDIWVKIKSGWNDDERALRKMGYQDM
jgi:GTP-binding protein Era